MPQVLVSPENIRDHGFVVEGSEAHHLIRVLRKKVNDEIELFDGQGRRYKGQLTHFDSNIPSASGKILQSLETPQAPYQLRLVQGIPKGAKIDYVIEKATELGVQKIHFFLSEKNIVQISPPDVKKKDNRWHQLAVAASKQCGRADIPTIQTHLKFGELHTIFSRGDNLILDPSGEMDLKTWLKKKPLSSPINLVVGPESGFSAKEIEQFKNWKVPVVKFGTRILRSETAGLAGLAALNFALDLA